MSDLLTIDVVKLQNIVNSAKNFDTNPDCSSDIKELLEASKLITSAMNQIKDFYKLDFAERNLVGKSIESDDVAVKVYESGSKFVIADEEIVPPEMLEVKLNTKAVSEYVEKNSKLPDGVSQKSRVYAVKLVLKEAHGII